MTDKNTEQEASSGREASALDVLGMRPSVKGVWHGEELFWKFQAGKLEHEISDKELRKWLNAESGMDYYRLPHDGIIRKQHSDAYIDQVLLCA